jgi:CheY-like chemotaxis protein/DNA-binding XRE family transcriptional regulator
MDSSGITVRFGASVKRLRHRLGISQEELAWRAELHRTYVSDIERGVRNPSLQSIERLAKALEVSFSTLFHELGDSADASGPTLSACTGRELVDILLIEDDPRHVELALAAFRKARVRNRIRVADGGARALQYLFGNAQGVDAPSQLPPDLILLDLSLPVVTGMDVLRQIRGDERTRQIPVVILTASHRSEDIVEARRLGAGLYIVKPVDFQGFCGVMAQLNCSWELVTGDAAR